MWWRRKQARPQEGSRALEEARKTLETTRSEREEVQAVTSFLRGQRLENHLSARINQMLREGR